MGDKGSAFTKGGLGCLGAFVVIAVLVLLLGGRVHIDVGGAICLFVFGGLVGLGIYLIYQRGRRDAGGADL